jgi:hypothetical protein
MLCDPDLTLASSPLKLPTFQIDGTSYYRRMTLLTHLGVIKWCFYPVSRAAANPRQIISWLRLNV